MSAPIALYPGLGVFDASLCRAGTCYKRQCSVIERENGSLTVLHRGPMCQGAAHDDPSHIFGKRTAQIVDGMPQLVATCRSCKAKRVFA